MAKFYGLRIELEIRDSKYIELRNDEVDRINADE